MEGSSSNQKHFPYGSISELFNFKASVVVLMDYDEDKTTKLLGLGHFVVYLITQTMHPILVTVCSVDGFHWPLTKDSIICRVAKRTFVITLPGLLYGLQFPPFCDEALVDSLEKVFIKFGHYFKVFDDKQLGYLLTDNEPVLWYKLHLGVEPTANEMLRRLGQDSGRSRFCVSNLNPCYQRAVRLSATTKFVINGAIGSGTLKGAYIVVKGTNPHPKQPDDEQGQITAYAASVSVFTYLVDSLECADVVSNGLGHLIKGVKPPLRTEFPNVAFKVWMLNEQALPAFIHDLGPAVEREEKIITDKNEKWKVKEQDREEAQASTSEPVASNENGKGLML